MQQSSKKREEEPHPCANNCGFFGSPATRNLCSKCFRDSTRLAEAEAQAGGLSSPSFAYPDQAAAEEEQQQDGGRGRQADGSRSRCAACGRKVGLTGFVCRCGRVFCGAHRYSDRHDCGYDYRGAARDAIARANPVVRADKQVDRL